MPIDLKATTSIPVGVRKSLGLPYSVMVYGAVGDGSTDDTAAIAATIDAASADGGGVVWVPAGQVFKYSSIAKTVDNITITGGGTLRSTLSKTSETIAFHIVGSNITIDNVTFDYTTAVVLASSDVDNRPTNGKTIRLGGTAGPDVWETNLRVVNCTIYDARNTAIDIYYGDEVLVAGNTIERSLGNGVFITDCVSDLRIVDNSIYDVGDDGVFIAVDSDLPARTKGVVVSGNHIELCDAKCIGLGGVDGAVISGNTLKSSYAPGIQLIDDGGAMENSRKVVIADNVIEAAGTVYGGGRLHDTVGTSGSGIELNDTPQDINITGNLITGSEKLGISATLGATRLHVADNTITDCGGFGIEIGDPGQGDYTLLDDVAIIGNAVRNVTGGGIIVGGGSNVRVSQNTVRSYDGGGAGDTWGVFYGWLEDSTIVDNLIINDDSATYTLHVYAGSTNPRLRLDHYPQSHSVLAGIVPPQLNTGGWNNVELNASYLFGAFRYGNGNQNDEAGWDLFLQEGTWDMEFVHRRDNNRGIYSVRLDGAELTTVDGYNASQDDVRSQVSTITVGTSGIHRVSFKMATKNASSSMYYGALQAFTLSRRV